MILRVRIRSNAVFLCCINSLGIVFNSVFLDAARYLPARYQSDERWTSFFRSLGIQQDMTEDLFIECAQTVSNRYKVQAGLLTDAERESVIVRIEVHAFLILTLYY